MTIHPSLQLTAGMLQLLHLPIFHLSHPVGSIVLIPYPSGSHTLGSLHLQSCLTSHSFSEDNLYQRELDNVPYSFPIQRTHGASPELNSILETAAIFAIQKLCLLISKIAFGTQNCQMAILYRGWNKHHFGSDCNSCNLRTVATSKMAHTFKMV